ncbi:DUF7344 domain-containing protein [Haloarcula nitratireducens]|uniref:ArsR family transcriptional regulator n=1 Tax=Haloarcula nitratireducens TaxID=2487749 RepID=A0AAW4PFF0_9EURY|nr:helix-turn-helix transcriptional regulator [Halomicroarcula nitratireducens]MBX0296700.1 ArsR family transcriptional regulator [Halomicroarcula nitratireducens]
MSSEPCHPNNAPRVDQLFELLSHTLRREIILFFENDADSQTATVDDLVSHLAGRVPTVNEDDLEIKLTHVHLPKLAGVGWLDYDRRTETVRYYGHDHAERWLEDLCTAF